MTITLGSNQSCGISHRILEPPLRPQPTGGGSFIPAYKKGGSATSSNPPTGRLGIVHSSLQESGSATLPNPPTGRLGIVHSSLQESGSATSSNPPTGRLGIVHSSLQRKLHRRRSRIPQPAGWGSFIPAYKKVATSSNPPTGRLGIVHSSLQESCIGDAPESPNRQVGDRSFQPTRKWIGDDLESPNRQVGDRSFRPR
jgi:hypothetical protein